MELCAPHDTARTVCAGVYEDTISSSTHNGVVVDGVNLDEMREFAKQFKIRRLSLGLTQTQVGQALSVTEGPSYSQSAICRSIFSTLFTGGGQQLPAKCKVKGKGSPHSTVENTVLELIPVLGSQPAGDVSHKPGGRLPLLSARPAVTFLARGPVPVSLLGEQRHDGCEQFA